MPTIEEKLKEIDEQVQALLKKRSEIQIEQEKVNINDLNWLKSCRVRVEVQQIWSIGLPRYKVFVESGNPPHTTRCVEVFGSSKDYHDNIMYTGRDYSSNVPYFYTSNKDTLVRFLKSCHFDSIKYDKDEFDLLLEIKQIADNRK